MKLLSVLRVIVAIAFIAFFVNAFLINFITSIFIGCIMILYYSLLCFNKNRISKGQGKIFLITTIIACMILFIILHGEGLNTFISYVNYIILMIYCIIGIILSKIKENKDAIMVTHSEFDINHLKKIVISIYLILFIIYSFIYIGRSFVLSFFLLLPFIDSNVSLDNFALNFYIVFITCLLPIIIIIKTYILSQKGKGFLLFSFLAIFSILSTIALVMFNYENLVIFARKPIILIFCNILSLIYSIAGFREAAENKNLD